MQHSPAPIRNVSTTGIGAASGHGVTASGRLASLASKAPDMDSPPVFRTVSGRAADAGGPRPSSWAKQGSKSNLSDTDRFVSFAGERGKTMKVVWLVVCVTILSTLARAEDAADVVDMISRYRREHGLSTVKTDPKLTAIAERQAKAMAASGIMDHSVAGSFAYRISDAHLGMASENIAAGTKTWAETFRLWRNSPDHNANLLQSRADSIGVAVSSNNHTRYKTFWAMVIAERSPKGKDRKTTAEGTTSAPRGSSHSSGSPLNAIKKFVCKFFC